MTPAASKVGFISITNTVPAVCRRARIVPGTNFWKIRSDRTNLGRLATLVHDLRRGGAGLIVLSIHWGPNYRWWPPQRYRRFARNAIDLGIDIVHGHSAHVLQAVEFHGNGLILYDTGDYMEDFLAGPGLSQRPLVPVPGRGRHRDGGRRSAWSRSA